MAAMRSRAEFSCALVAISASCEIITEASQFASSKASAMEDGSKKSRRRRDAIPSGSTARIVVRSVLGVSFRRSSSMRQVSA